MSTQLLLKTYAHKKVKDLEDDMETDSRGSMDDDLDEEEDEELKTPTKLILVGVVLGALTMIGLYSLSATVFLMSSPVLLAAGGVAIFVGGAAVVTEIELSKMETFRAIHNKMRKDVMVFADENTKLTASNDELNLQVFMLKENEQRFVAIAEEQNSNVQDLVRLVAQNQKCIDKMKQYLHEDLVESLINAVFDEERNEDGELSDREIKRLLARLSNMSGVTVNEELLTETIKKDRSVMTLIEIIKDLNVEGDQLGDRIFVIDETDPALMEQFT